MAAGTCQQCGKYLCGPCVNLFDSPLCVPCLISMNREFRNMSYLTIVIFGLLFFVGFTFHEFLWLKLIGFFGEHFGNYIEVKLMNRLAGFGGYEVLPAVIKVWLPRSLFYGYLFGGIVFGWQFLSRYVFTLKAEDSLIGWLIAGAFKLTIAVLPGVVATPPYLFIRLRGIVRTYIIENQLKKAAL